MARTPITVIESSKAGTILPAPTAADVVNGNSITVDPRTAVIATNTGASTRNITITPTATVDGLPVGNRTIALAAGVARLLGPYDVSTYSATLQISADNAEVTFRPIRVAGA